MNTRVRRLFTLAATHAYYGGVCPDFAFTIPSDTARILAGGRLFAKVIHDELAVVYELNTAATGPRVTCAGRRLRFGLRLVNPEFRNITALPAAPGDALHIYRNGTTPAALDAAETLACTPELFAHPLSGSTRPVTVSVLRGTSPVRTEVVADARATASLDLRGLAPGRIEIEETFAGGVTQRTPYYLDAEMKREGAFGIVEIDVAAGFYTSAPSFRIAFDAPLETLKYYVVVSNYSNADVAALAVKDNGFAEEGRPEITFSKVLPAAFTADDLPAATLTAPGSSLLLFKSQSPVRRRAQPRRKLQLKKNADALIEHLPQPGSSHPTADLVVHLSKRA